MKHKRSTMGYTVSCVALSVLFIASIIPSNAADSVKITADFEDYKTFELQRPIILHCNVTLEPARNDGYSLVWSKDGGEIIPTNDYFKDRTQILSLENKLIIKKTTESDAGLYTCSLVNQTHIKDTVQVVSRPSVKLPADTSVIEGEKLKLTCLVAGSPTPEVVWVVGNVTYTNSTERVKLESANNVTGAMLTIAQAERSDFGDYICRASNVATKNSQPTEATTHVRVKDKFAALWPFLGICAEVFILCAVILVYEKRRNKPEMEDSDTDQSPDQKK